MKFLLQQLIIFAVGLASARAFSQGGGSGRDPFAPRAGVGLDPWRTAGLYLRVGELELPERQQPSPFLRSDAMASEQQALLQAIAASPEDDLPRLVYADWLHEHELLEAEAFIRLQIEIAKRPKNWRSLANQALEILRRNYISWYGPLLHDLNSAEIHSRHTLVSTLPPSELILERGFPFAFRCGRLLPEAIAAQLTIVERRHVGPLLGLEIGGDGQLEAAQSSGQFATLKALKGHHAYIPFLNSRQQRYEFLEKITDLTIIGTLMADDFSGTHVLALPLENIQTLTLDSIGQDGFLTLLAQDRFRALRSLRIQQRRASVASIFVRGERAPEFDFSRLPQLKEFGLSDLSMNSPARLRAIVDSLPKLDVLDLSGNAQLGAKDLRDVLVAQPKGKFQKLDISPAFPYPTRLDGCYREKPRASAACTEICNHYNDNVHYGEGS